MIDSSIKDKVVADIIVSADKTMQMEADYQEKADAIGISRNEYSEIVRYLDRIGLIRLTPLMGGYARIRPQVEIYDLYNEGGFVARDELLKANLRKLDMELYQLEQEIDPALTDRIKKIADIASSVSSALGLLRF